MPIVKPSIRSNIYVKFFLKFFWDRCGECCVIRHKNRWYRARCVEVCRDGWITVELVDFGCVNIYSINDVRNMPAELGFDSITMTSILLPKLASE